MKNLLFLLFLITGTAQAQTITVNGQRVYTQAGVDAAIKAAIAAQAKIQANTDALKDARFTKIEARLNDTIFFDKKFLPVIGKTVTFSLDSLAKYLKVPAPVVDLTAVNTSLSILDGRATKAETRLTAVEIRVTSLEQWRTLIQSDMDATKLYINKLKGLTLTTTLPQ